MQAIYSGRLWGWFMRAGRFYTEELLPSRQTLKIKEMAIVYETTTAAYSREWCALFGFNGLADLIKDHFIGFNELTNAYYRMGYTNAFVQGETSLPGPSVAQLKRAIRSYKTRE